MTPAIHAERLTRSFESVRAVDSLSLEVPAHTIFGFLGPNGAGKTTTIHLLLGLMEPTDGAAEVLGLDTRRHADRIRACTGSLLEHHGLYEQLTAEENLEFQGRAWRMPAGDRRERTRELLTGMELWERRNEPIGTWSRGMKQRLALARALFHRPALLFLDEPTAGLDVVAANEVRQELANLVAGEGVTVFLTTHNMSEAEKLCSEVAVIRAGHLVAQGKPAQLRAGGASHVEVQGKGLTDVVLESLRREPGVSGLARRNGDVRIDLTGEAEVSRLVSRLVEMGVDVEEVRRGRASLEDVFLTLMAEEGGAS